MYVTNGSVNGSAAQPAFFTVGNRWCLRTVTTVIKCAPCVLGALSTDAIEQFILHTVGAPT